MIGDIIRAILGGLRKKIAVCLFRVAPIASDFQVSRKTTSPLTEGDDVINSGARARMAVFDRPSRMPHFSTTILALARAPQ